MTVKEIRAMAGLSQQAFADKYGIPKRTVENWESNGSGKRDCPEYVMALLERAVSEDYRIIIDNHTTLSDQEAMFHTSGVLAGIDKDFKVTVNGNLYTIEEL